MKRQRLNLPDVINALRVLSSSGWVTKHVWAEHRGTKIKSAWRQWERIQALIVRYGIRHERMELPRAFGPRGRGPVGVRIP